MKIYTIENATGYPAIEIGKTVKLNLKSFTGDSRYKTLKPTIKGIEQRAVGQGSTLEADGFTHEEVYIVEYNDFTESVLWPEEVLG